MSASQQDKESPGTIAERLEVVEVAKGDPAEVWHMRDPKTGKEYYAKTASPAEVEMTQKAAQLHVPDNSPLKIAKLLTTNIPATLKDKVHFEGSRSGFVIVEAVPHGASLGQLAYGQKGYDYGEISPEWKKSPITAAEYEALIDSVRQMNEAGVFNHDLASNSEVFRGKDGKLNVHIYDFEAHSFKRLYQGQQPEDVAQILNDGKALLETGALAPDAAKLLERYEGTFSKAGPPSATSPEKPATQKTFLTGNQLDRIAGANGWQIASDGSEVRLNLGKSNLSPANIAALEKAGAVKLEVEGKSYLIVGNSEPRQANLLHTIKTTIETDFDGFPSKYRLQQKAAAAPEKPTHHEAAPGKSASPDAAKPAPSTPAEPKPDSKAPAAGGGSWLSRMLETANEAKPATEPSGVIKHTAPRTDLAKQLFWPTPELPPPPKYFKPEHLEARNWDVLAKELQREFTNKGMSVTDAHTAAYDIANYVRDYSARPTYVEDRALRQFSNAHPDAEVSQALEFVRSEVRPRLDPKKLRLINKNVIAGVEQTTTPLPPSSRQGQIPQEVPAGPAKKQPVPSPASPSTAADARGSAPGEPVTAARATPVNEPPSTAKPTPTTEPQAAKRAGIPAGKGAAIGGAGAGVVMGSKQLYDGIKHGNVGDIGLGTANTVSAGTLGAAELQAARAAKKGAEAAAAQAGGKLATAGKLAGHAAIPLIVLSAAHDAYKEEGTSAEDKNTYKAVRFGTGIGVGAVSIGVGSAASALGTSAVVVVGAPIVAAVAVGYTANEMIEVSKQYAVEDRRFAARHDNRHIEQAANAILSKTPEENNELRKGLAARGAKFREERQPDPNDPLSSAIDRSLRAAKSGQKDQLNMNDPKTRNDWGLVKPNKPRTPIPPRLVFDLNDPRTREVVREELETRKAELRSTIEDSGRWGPRYNPLVSRATAGRYNLSKMRLTVMEAATTELDNYSENRKGIEAQRAQRAREMAESLATADNAFRQLDKNKDGKLDVQDFDIKHYANKDSEIDRKSLEEMHKDILALKELEKGNPQLATIRHNMERLTTEIDKELTTQEKRIAQEHAAHEEIKHDLHELKAVPMSGVQTIGMAGRGSIQNDPWSSPRKVDTELRCS